MKTKFILDSGIVKDYEIATKLAKENNSEIWGATTNPSLIAKNILARSTSSGSTQLSTKVTLSQINKLHKEIILQLVKLVRGAVSAEVYADQNTKAEEMITQGKEIASWHENIVVKIPTTIEGFRARTELRKLGIPTNNTLVFSQQQILAICLHEALVQKECGAPIGKFPSFISPFVGRLDDMGLNGMDLVKHGMNLKKLFPVELWMLEASVRNVQHFKKGIDLESELITAPLKIYEQYFALAKPASRFDSTPTTMNLEPILAINWPRNLVECPTISDFMQLLATGSLDIHHDLTDKGIQTFANDWNSILQ